MSRTPEDRERARLEREARRRSQTGEQTPSTPQPAPETPQAQPVEPEPVAQPQPAEPEPQPPQVAAEPRAQRTLPSERPHVRERVDAALARSRSRRREPIPVPPAANGDAPGSKRGHGRFFVPFLIALVVIGLAAAWFLNSLYQPGKGEGSGRVTVTVPRGGSLAAIADRLGESGVISKPFFFKLRARTEGHANDLKPGVYVMQKDMAYGDVIKKLTAGPPRNIINVTIPEGRARSEVAPLIKQAGIRGNYDRATVRNPHLSPRRYGAPRSAGLEGFLFPSTYELKKRATVRALVGKQLDTFKQKFSTVGMSYAKK